MSIGACADAMRLFYRFPTLNLESSRYIFSSTNSWGTQFYAHLYAGLYFEATGNRERARAKITTAADHYTAGG